MKKHEILALLEQQPEEVDLDQFMETLEFRRKLELALDDVKHGRLISQEEMERITNEWLA